MPTTSPDNIFYADGTTPASLATITAAMATSVQDALNLREAHSFSWVDLTARNAQTGMVTGDLGYQIDNATYYRYSGSAWTIWAKAETAYSPTFTNFTASSASFTYSISGGRVFITGKATCAATLPTGSITLTTPSGYSISMTNFANTPASVIGIGGVDDASTSTDYPLSVRTVSSTSVSVIATNAAGTYATVVATSSAIPLTWASGDIMYLSFSYPVA
jgi:hypothetical protein